MGEAELVLATDGHPVTETKEEAMKKHILSILLAIIPLFCFSQKYGRIVQDPLTGEMEYVYNPYAEGDSIVNLGYGNYPIGEGTLSTMIGFGNVMGSYDGLSIGWDNATSCNRVYALGKNLYCNADEGMPIGMSERTAERRMPGSVAFCPTGDYAVMHVHSGFPQARNRYTENIGGVRIGRGYTYNNDSTALEVIAHMDTTSATVQVIATENDEWVLYPDSMTLAGSVQTGYLESPYTPKVHSAASDTSLLPTPLKVGDYYIDTSARDVYIATGTSKGSWRKVN